MQMCPEWCTKYMDCWGAIVDRWLSEESYELRRSCRACRMEMQGVPHHQGNQSLPVFMERWVSFYLFFY